MPALVITRMLKDNINKSNATAYRWDMRYHKKHMQQSKSIAEFIKVIKSPISTDGMVRDTLLDMRAALYDIKNGASPEKIMWRALCGNSEHARSILTRVTAGNSNGNIMLRKDTTQIDGRVYAKIDTWVCPVTQQRFVLGGTHAYLYNETPPNYIGKTTMLEIRQGGRNEPHIEVYLQYISLEGTETVNAWLSGKAEGAEIDIGGTRFIYTATGDGVIVLVDAALLHNDYVAYELYPRSQLQKIDRILSQGTSRYLAGQPMTSPTAHTMGVELELEEVDENPKSATTVRSITDKLRAALGWDYSVTAVWDNSLRYGGVEFVTGWGEPYHVANAVEAVLEDETLRIRLNKQSYMGSRCGLHLHFGKQGFADKRHIAEVQWVLERREFAKVVERVAGRYNTRYCKANQRGARPEYPQTYDKFRAVNCQHENTVEFRMFSAPKNSNDMVLYTSFVISIIEWMRDRPTYCTPRYYGAWLDAHTEYAVLRAHLGTTVEKLA